MCIITFVLCSHCHVKFLFQVATFSTKFIKRYTYLTKYFNVQKYMYVIYARPQHLDYSRLRLAPKMSYIHCTSSISFVDDHCCCSLQVQYQVFCSCLQLQGRRTISITLTIMKEYWTFTTSKNHLIPPPPLLPLLLEITLHHIYYINSPFSTIISH